MPATRARARSSTTLSPFELSVLADFFPAAAPLAARACPSYPPGRQCNSKGLTPLGAYLIRRLIANHMLIEVDHLSEKARDRVLEIAERHDYPLVSSHNGTGGPGPRRSCGGLYGSAASRPRPPTRARARGEDPRAPRAIRSRGRYFGVGLGTDTGGFSALPGPRDDAASDPLPTRSAPTSARSSFNRQRTGERIFDLNTDGVAHYGLFADLLADMQRQPGGDRALRSLFRSAEAYLRMWRRAAVGR